MIFIFLVLSVLYSGWFSFDLSSTLFYYYSLFVAQFSNNNNGLITVPTVAQANMIKCSHCPQPQVNLHMWHHFENYIKSTNKGQHGCIFDAIIGEPVWHWRFNDLCNLLLDETPIFASTDVLVHADLRYASCGWLFWSVADDANFHMRTDGDDAPASSIVVLTCRTKIVHGHFDSTTSYGAVGTGLLIISFLVADLMKFLLLDSLPQINHNCDNQELIVKMESMLPTKRAWWWYDVTDSDLICETLHWGQKIQWTPRWERGHPEWRIPERSKWSYSEWGYHFADSLAD